MADCGHLVMIVDDDDAFREEVREALEVCGLRVIDAANGRAALALLEEARPELIITDIHMPEMDGVELVLRLRETLPDVPVIAVSAGDSWGYMGNLEATVPLGATRALAKPVDLAELMRVASELVEHGAKTEPHGPCPASAGAGHIDGALNGDSPRRR